MEMEMKKKKKNPHLTFALRVGVVDRVRLPLAGELEPPKSSRPRHRDLHADASTWKWGTMTHLFKDSGLNVPARDYAFKERNVDRLSYFVEFLPPRRFNYPLVVVLVEELCRRILNVREHCRSPDVRHEKLREAFHRLPATLPARPPGEQELLTLETHK